MNSSEYIYPTKRSQIIYLMLLVVFLAIYFNVDSLMENINALDNTEDIKVVLIVLSIVVSSLFAYLGYWMIVFGTRIFKENRYPPKGFPIVFRTKVTYGKSALFQGVASYVMSFVMLVFSVVFIHMGWSSYGI